MSARSTRTISRGLGTVIVCALTVISIGLSSVALTACGEDVATPATTAATLFPSAAAGSSDRHADPSATPSPTAADTGVTPSASSGDGASSASPDGTSTATTGVTDAGIRGNILVRLSQEPTLRDVEFKVTVRHRVVILEARVKTKKQKTAAEQIAVTEPGVKKVLSYIVVAGGGGY